MEERPNAGKVGKKGSAQVSGPRESFPEELALELETGG